MKFGKYVLISALFLMIFLTGCETVNQNELAMEKASITGPTLKAQCLVTVFDDTGNKYFTTQKHKIYPQDQKIIITASEPEGDFTWGLNKGNFFLKNTNNAVEQPKFKVCSHGIAQTVLLAVSAAGGFLDDHSGLIGEPLSISGQMYEPVIVFANAASPVAQIVYRQQVTHKIDWVKVENETAKSALAGRCYNLREIKNTDKHIPTSIDIYNTDKNGRPADRIMHLEYSSIEFKQAPEKSKK